MHRDVQNLVSFGHLSIHQGVLEMLWTTHHEALFASQRTIVSSCSRLQFNMSIPAMSGLTVGTAGPCVHPSNTPGPNLEFFSCDLHPSIHQDILSANPTAQMDQVMQ